MATKNEEILKALEALGHAAHNLTNLWSDVNDEQDKALCTGYPFAESFDDIVLNIAEWGEQVKIELNKKS